MYASNRKRFEFKLNELPRDRRVAAWIDWQQGEGRDASEMIKNLIDEVITGQSCLTGRNIVYQGEVNPILPSPSDDNEVAEALLKIED
jgi:hypothetical protein